ncbi:MAG: hypothetical protein HUJ25_08015 [Crocinitomicaceae bacterium]|nr:hypothetical protein [Crocinitomicaceae bacterium]
MRKALPIVFLLALITTSCGESKIPEGEITYEITYPHMEVTGLMSAILPKEMTIVFKGTQMKTTISRGHIFETDVVTNEANESIEMRLDFGDKKYFCPLTKAEIKELRNTQPVYTINKTDEQDSIAGLWCTKYNVSSKDSIQPDAAWFTEDLSVQNGAWFSAYNSVTGMPVVYDVERYGLMMHVSATNFIKRKVKDNEFDRPSELTKVDFSTYETEVQELFDILLD